MTSPFSSLTRRTPTTTAATTPPAATASTPATTPAPAATRTEVAPVTAPVPAPATELAQVDNTPVNLSVISRINSNDGGSTGYQFTQILGGVVGTKNGEKFTFDPVYPKIAYLFTLAKSGVSADTDFVEVTLPNKKAGSEFVLNMVKASMDRWAAMYKQLESTMPAGLGASMLAGDRESVKADEVIAEANLTSYQIPVSFSVHISQEDRATAEEVATPMDLISIGVSDRSSFALDESAEIAQEGITPVVMTSLPDDIRQHNGGIDLVVGAKLNILASSYDNAKAIMVQLVKVSEVPMLQNALVLSDMSIKNSTLVPYERIFEGPGGY